jgi:hypothetical protein
MILVSKYLLPRGYNGLTIFPFVFLKNKDLKLNRVVLNHEKIHLRQQLELLIIPFYIWYILEFFIRLLYYRNWHLAYRNISFEREAYRNENNFKYLKQRRFWRFLKYLRN